SECWPKRERVAPFIMQDNHPRLACALREEDCSIRAFPTGESCGEGLRAHDPATSVTRKTWASLSNWASPGRSLSMMSRNGHIDCSCYLVVCLFRAIRGLIEFVGAIDHHASGILI